jgi:prevent-host-death family protein
MNSVGSYEAKTLLPSLLQRVKKGERIIITRRGIGIAMLVPVEEKKYRNVREVIAELRASQKRFRTGSKKHKIPLYELRHEGHRY